MRTKKISFIALLSIIFLTGAIISPGIAQEEISTNLTNVSIQKFDKELEVLIELEGKFNYETFTLIDPHRLVFDFWPVEAVLVEPVMDIKASGVNQIRIGKFQEKVARIVFDLLEPLPTYRIKPLDNGIKIIFKQEKEVVKEEIKAPEEVEEKPIEEVEKVEKIEEKPKEVEKIEKIEEVVPPPKKRALNLHVGFNAGRYNISSDRFKEVYGSGSMIWAFELSKRVYHLNNQEININIGAGYFSKKGETTATKDTIRLTLKPISLGANYLIKLQNNLIPFFGFGLSYYIYKEDWNVFSAKDTKLGYYLNGGLYYQIPMLESLKVKLYLLYSRATVKPEGSNIEGSINIGGFQFGLGLVWTF